MSLYFHTVFGFCVISVIGNEHKERERVASLIVLPPIVLGYDELYDDLNSKKPNQKEPEKPKEVKREATPVRSEKPVGFKRMNVPWDQLVAYDDPRGEDAIIIPQQRLVLKRTKDGKIVVPDKEWTITSKEKVSQVNNANRMPKQNESRLNGDKNDCKHYQRQGDNTMNTDANNQNKAPGNGEGKTKIDNYGGGEEDKKDNVNVEKEGPGKAKPSNGKEELNDKKYDKEELKDENNTKVLDTTKVESNNKIDGEEVVAERITTFTTVVTPEATSLSENIGKEEPTIEAEYDKLTKKKNMHIALPGNGVISDPLSGDILNFKGNFVLPHKLFDCPCAKNKS